MTDQEFVEVWTTRASELEPYAPGAAEAWRRAAAELRERDASAKDSVTLREAHEIGGYSVDYLQKVVKAGTIENVGSRGRIRIRRSDVPIKPGHAALRTPRRRPQLSASAVVASAIGRKPR